MSTPDQAPVPAPAPAPAAAAPAKKSNTLVIVLCVVLGIILLMVGSCVATCIYVGKKARTYAEESKKNPQISALALAATLSPGVEVVSKDLDAGTIVLKNKKTGETVKLNAADFSQEKIAEVIDRIAQGKGVPVTTKAGSSAGQTVSSSASSDAGSPTVSAAQAAAQSSTLKKFPADFPVYTGGNVRTLEASQETLAGMSTAQHVFLTGDAPDVVAESIGKKLAAAGYTQKASENGSDEHGATLTSLFQKDGMSATVNLSIHIEDGQTHVEISQVLLKR